jgi:hypothetical protein
MPRKVFHWVVRHLHWVARVPGAPHLFDAMLFSWTAVFCAPRRRAMERFEQEIARIHGLQIGTHRLGGCAFRTGGRELAHLHGNGLLDAWVGSEQAAALLEQQAAEPHHVLGHSGWVSFWIEGAKDLPGALRIIDLALAAAQARGGAFDQASRR